jgi:hypothetical protein
MITRLAGFILTLALIACATEEPGSQPTFAPGGDGAGPDVAPPTAAAQRSVDDVEATPTPTEPVPTPIAPIILEGASADVVDLPTTEPRILRISGNPTGRHFAVTSFDAAGDQTDLLVNTTDPYEGIVPVNFREGEASTRLQIETEAPWRIEVLPLSAGRVAAIPGSIEGVGDEVILVSGDPDTATITGNSEARHFAVLGWGARSELLVNTTDPYNGQVIVARDTVLLQVNAVGSWEIIFE